MNDSSGAGTWTRLVRPVLTLSVCSASDTVTNSCCEVVEYFRFGKSTKSFDFVQRSLNRVLSSRKMKARCFRVPHDLGL
ncbi:hypothetical protein BDW60DRAFT_173508 [Aspergillus nidulans var. acristatus]